jgi:hypothetical protein
LWSASGHERVEDRLEIRVDATSSIGEERGQSF